METRSDVLLTIGTAIEKGLKATGKTQDELAENIGVSRGHVNSIVNGKVDVKITEMLSILEFLPIDLKDVFPIYDTKDSQAKDSKPFILFRIAQQLPEKVL